MKSIAIISVAAEQGDEVTRVKWKPMWGAGFEMTGPDDDLQSQSEPIAVPYQPIPETHARLSILPLNPRHNKDAFLPKPNDTRHACMRLHTRFSKSGAKHAPARPVCHASCRR